MSLVQSQKYFQKYHFPFESEDFINFLKSKDFMEKEVEKQCKTAMCLMNWVALVFELKIKTSTLLELKKMKDEV